MRIRRFERRARPAGRLVLHRRDLLKGGLGLVTGAMVGGLADSYDRYAAPAVPAHEPVAPEPEPVEPVGQEPDAPAQDVEDVEDVEREEEVPEEPPAPAALRRGDSGEEVLALQQELGTHGYWCGTPDAVFGHLTQQAVWAVQKAHGLRRDGVAGALTRQALATGHRPAPVAGGDHLEVHLGSQLLLVVRGGRTVTVLNTSTGNGEPYEFGGHEYVAHTPTGDFTVWYVDGSGWREGELGELYRPMFYDGNYAVHGSASIPPVPASHGCARISVDAMDMVWAQRLLGMGGRVVVV